MNCTSLYQRRRPWFPTYSLGCRSVQASSTSRFFATSGDVDLVNDRMKDQSQRSGSYDEECSCPRDDDSSVLRMSKLGTWTQVDREFWEKAMLTVSKTSAVKMIARLKQDDPLGVDTNLRGASKGKGTVYEFALGVRLKHKHKLLLIRVGDFYEAFGFDAVILVQYAGLNPMGHSGVPRAGCPHQNIAQTLRDLTKAGFTTVVCEEVPEPPSLTRRTKRKQRFVAGIVSQASPEYVFHRSFTKSRQPLNVHGVQTPQLFGIPEGSPSTDSFIDSLPELPVVGISATSRGISIACVDVDLRQVRLMEGLTEEAATTRILAGGFAPPLYIHDSLFQRAIMPQAPQGQGMKYGRMVGPLAEACRNTARVCRFSGAIPHRELVTVACENLGLQSESLFRIIRANIFQGPSFAAKVPDAPVPDHVFSDESSADKAACELAAAPMPLTLHSAQQLGVLSFPGIPSLLEYLLPSSAPAACHQWMREKLLHPPAPEVASAIRKACNQLASLRQPLPIFESSTRAGRAVKLVTSYQADHLLFHDILNTTAEVRDFLQNRYFDELASYVLVVSEAETGIKFSLETLKSKCTAAAQIISDIIEEPSCGSRGVEFSLLEEGLEVIKPVSADSENLLDILKMEFLPSLCAFVNQVEIHCWGKIKDEHIELQVTRLLEARKQFLSAILQGFYPVVDAIGRQKNVKQTLIVHDSQNKAVWLKLPKKYMELPGNEEHRLFKATDRNGQRVADKFTTEAIENTRHQYFLAIHDLHQQIEKVLWKLSHTVAHEHLPCIITSCFFATIARSLTLHVSHCLSKNWASPQVDPESRNLTILGMWPYWLSKYAASTVCNDVTLSGLMLLTGPNMAGKSTIIRSLGVVCLLANCGFMTPVETAQIPQFSSFSVRMMCADSPLEGQSAFAVEMLDLNYILRTSGTSSLVLVDEVGRGTEPGMGTALSGSVLEALDRTGCIGIFATHLHGILDLPLETTRINYMAMETKPEKGRNIATWKLVDGVNRQSLAIETAIDCGIPLEVASRAEHLLTSISSGGTHNSSQAEQAQEMPESQSYIHSDALHSNFLSTMQERICRILDHHSKAGSKKLLVLEVQKNQLVPPSINSTKSCVYAFQPMGTRAYYIGETDSINQRIQAHRKRHVDAIFHVVPVPGGKSLARLVEAELIRSLKFDGFPVKACKDASNINFGGKT